jgi:hypothetical protein
MPALARAIWRPRTAFYDATLAPLGIKTLGLLAKPWFSMARPSRLFWCSPGNGEAPSGNGVTLGFAAASPAEVDAFHAAGLAAGGTDEGAAGARSHLPGAYAGYLRDPAGNKICAYTFV